MKLLIDSREQRPYSFESASEVGALPTGDYSIVGLENHVAVERKELNDLISCLTQERDRFEKELSRGRALDYFALVIEAKLSDIIKGRYLSQMLPKAAFESLIAFSVRYHLPVFFAETRAIGQKLTESLLCKFAREIVKKAELAKLSKTAESQCFREC